MRRREFITLIGSAATWPYMARAQQARLPVIGYLSGRSTEAEAALAAAFRRGLAETGYVQGQNVAIDFLFSDGQDDRLQALAAEFVRRQVDLLRPGGVLVVSDHTTDPDAVRADWHQEIERGRDKTHVRNLAPGQLVDLLGRVGLRDLRFVEETFALDFDEWFDRGTPGMPKEEVRRRTLSGMQARGFTVTYLRTSSSSRPAAISSGRKSVSR